MERVSALLAICVGNSPVTGEFPAQSVKCQFMLLVFSLYVFARIVDKNDTIVLRPYFGKRVTAYNRKSNVLLEQHVKY